MANRFKRGSAPGRARSEDQRPGSFQKGHKKLGGRRRGTPNKFSAEYKNLILEAASRVGMDANGMQGIVGYFQWIAMRQPRIMYGLLGSVMELQELEVGLPQGPPPTVEELNETVAKSADSRTAVNTRPKEPTPQQTEGAQRSSTRKRSKSEAGTKRRTQLADLPWAWTGRDDPVGQLMHLAITAPNEFGGLLQAMLPRPTALQRGLAARRAWEERQRAEERQCTEQHPGVAS